MVKKGEEYRGFRWLRATARRYRDGSVIWECECLACGELTDVTFNQVDHGRRTSCGCSRGREPIRYEMRVCDNPSFRDWYRRYRTWALAHELPPLPCAEASELARWECAICELPPSARHVATTRIPRVRGVPLHGPWIPFVHSELWYDGARWLPLCPGCYDLRTIE